MTKNEFIERMISIILEVQKEENISDASCITCLGQACIETGFGSSDIMMKYNAPFGIKTTKSHLDRGGKSYSAKTKEFINGSYSSQLAGFRAYNSLKESIQDYFRLMRIPRYNDSLTASTYQECITIIHKNGYATSPNYSTNVMNLIFRNSLDKKFIEIKYKNSNSIYNELVQIRNMIDALLGRIRDGHA